MENKIRIGQFYKSKEGFIYILASVSLQGVALIAVKEFESDFVGNVWKPAVQVKELFDITKEEFEQMSLGTEWTCIDAYVCEIPPENECGLTDFIIS